MANLKNSVNPLSWNVPIVDKLGNATPEFQRKWEQQAATNGSIPDLTTAAAVSGVLDKISATPGSLLARGASAWAGLAPSADGKILRDKGAGNAPIWDTLSNVVDLIGNVQGDVLYRSAAGWVALPPGTAGQVFTTGGPGANPSWAAGGGSGGGAASAQDNGSTLYLALSDADAQLVLDGSGDPILVPEVVPPAALPVATTTAFGAVKPDGTTIAAVAGVLSAVGLPGALCFQAKLTADQTVTSGAPALCKPDTFVTNTLGTQYATGTGKFTPTKAGKYIVFTTAQGKATSPDTITQANGSVFKNGGSGVGTQICVGQCGPAPAAPIFSFVSLAFGVVDMNGTTDTLEMSVRVDASGAAALVALGAGNVTFGAIYIGP